MVGKPINLGWHRAWRDSEKIKQTYHDELKERFLASQEAQGKSLPRSSAELAEFQRDFEAFIKDDRQRDEERYYKLLDECIAASNGDSRVAAQMLGDAIMKDENRRLMLVALEQFVRGYVKAHGKVPESPEEMEAMEAWIMKRDTDAGTSEIEK
jgi:hypothetical protein